MDSQFAALLRRHRSAAGFTQDGLPLGAQLLGPAGSEPLLVSLAAQLEADRKWTAALPDLAMRQ